VCVGFLHIKTRLLLEHDSVVAAFGWCVRPGSPNIAVLRRWVYRHCIIKWSPGQFYLEHCSPPRISQLLHTYAKILHIGFSLTENNKTLCAVSFSGLGKLNVSLKAAMRVQFFFTALRGPQKHNLIENYTI